MEDLFCGTLHGGVRSPQLARVCPSLLERVCSAFLLILNVLVIMLNFHKRLQRGLYVLQYSGCSIV